MHVARSRSFVLLLVIGVLLLLMLAAGPAAQAGPRSLIIDPSASPSWVQPLAGPAGGTDGATDVVFVKRDVILVLGTLTNAAGKTDISLSRYAGDTLQWTRVWSGPGGDDDTARRMALSSDGKWVYICGSSMKAGNSDVYVLKRSTGTGKLAWARKYDGPAHGMDIAAAIGVDARDNVVVAAWSQSATDLDYAVVSWTRSGAARWTWRWGGGVGNDTPYDLYVEPNGKSYVTGIVAVSGGGPAVGTARLSANGRKLWTRKYRGPEGLGAGGTTMVRRPGGGVYIGGLVVRAATGNDALLVQYSGNGARTVVAIDDAGGAATNELWWDITVTSTRAILCGGSTTAANADARACIYRPDGSVVFSGTKAGAWPDAFMTVAADAFGGWYVAGTHHTAAAIQHVFVFRSTLLQLGGTWSCEWGGATDGNAPAAMAVRDTSCAVVGSMNGGATGIDQLVMMFNY